MLCISKLFIDYCNYLLSLKFCVGMSVNWLLLIYNFLGKMLSYWGVILFHFILGVSGVASELHCAT